MTRDQEEEKLKQAIFLIEEVLVSYIPISTDAEFDRYKTLTDAKFYIRNVMRRL